MKNLTGNRIIPFFLVSLLFFGCQAQENIGQVQQPIQTQQSLTEETQQIITGVLKLESGATMKIPEGWSVKPYVPDPQFSNYDVKIPNEALFLAEYHVPAWLKGPNPDEGYVIPHEERPNALAILKDIYDHQAVTNDVHKQFDQTAGEFLGYGNLYRSAVTYVANNDKSYRGISFYNLQGQDVGVSPAYYIALYNPDKGSILLGVFGIGDEFKEVADANKELQKIDWNGADSGSTQMSDIWDLDRQLHENFKKLVETKARKDLSFGPLLNQIDQFFQSVSP